MALLLDASVLIEHERGHLDIESRISGRGQQGYFLSVVTASELLHGVHRARDAATRNMRASWVEAVIERFPVLPVDLASARAHARLSAQLALEGRLIGPNDLWLAATALSRGLALVTANRREFERVPGLALEHWS
jgi:tRNA(fMet)-specific endonuclease VapC